MSTFRVKLVQGNQSVAEGTLGNLGTGNVGGYVGDPASDGSTTIQRTIWAPGPNHTNRQLFDGDTFNDCNYWKRFAYPQVAYDQAFIEVVSDDGSTYSDVPSENIFSVVADFTVTAGTTYTDAGNSLDIVDVHGGVAIFTQITTDEPVKVRLNGSSSAVLDVAAGTQTFDIGEVVLTEIAFDNTASGASDASVQVLFSIKSACNS